MFRRLGPVALRDADIDQIISYMEAQPPLRWLGLPGFHTCDQLGGALPNVCARVRGWFQIPFEPYFVKVHRAEQSIPVHVDVGRIAAINVMLQSPKESVTKFYSDDQTAEIGSFTYDRKVAYLLDVRRPHAVHFGGSGMRYTISIAFTTLSFADLLSLHDSGKLLTKL